MSTLQTEVLLETRIADKAGVPVDDVRDVFTEYGLPLVVSPARPRSLRVHRLRVVGERTGDVEPGPFNTPMTFSAGLTALVASNFRGKTSVLELLTWCLRGTPRSEMQNRVRGWLRQVDLDATIAGEAMGFRLDLADGEITSAAVLTGKDAAALADVRAPDPARGVTALLRAASTDTYAEQIAGLMLGRMDLQPLVNSFKETSTQTHGWPAYFGAVYLPAGGDKALLGEVATNGLPGRPLQVFLDLPAAAALTRVKAVRDVRVAEAKARRSAAQAEAAERALEREHLETELSRARDHLADLLPDSENDTPLVDLASAAVQPARTLADAQQAWDEASTTFRRARTERQQAAKLLNDWDLAIEDNTMVQRLVATVAQLPRQADMERLRRAVLGGIDPSDVDTMDQATNALSEFESLTIQAGSLTAAAAQLRIVEEGSVIEPGVHLLNAHTGKGQQFDWVFVPGFEGWHIPDGRADTAEQLAEELRVVLVMVSRARHGIVITRARSPISKARNPYATRESQWWPVIVEACPMNADTLAQPISTLVTQAAPGDGSVSAPPQATEQVRPEVAGDSVAAGTVGQ